MKFPKPTRYLLLVSFLLQTSVSHLLRSTTTTTTPTQHAMIKRDAGIATLTLAPYSEYLKAAETPRTATGTQFFIVPRAKATDGVDVYMGIDLLKSLRTAVAEKCMNEPNAVCEASVAAALPHPRVDFQRTNFPIDFDLTALGIIAIIVASLRTTKREDYTGHWHLAEYEEWEGMKASPSPTIVVVTGTGDVNPFTISSTNRPGPTVSSLANGDTIIKFDETLRHDLNDFLSKIGARNCANSRKRVPDVECLVPILETVLQNTLNGPLAALGQQVAVLPQPGGTAAEAILLPALVRFVDISRDACYSTMGYNPHLDQMTRVELMVFWVVTFYVDFVQLALEIMIYKDATNQRCASFLDDCDDSFCQGKNGRCSMGNKHGCLCSSSGCLPGDRIASCVNCGGDDGSAHCPGIN